MEQPRILTLQIDPAAQELLNGWRKEYFPADRNVLDAHITMFHALPGDQDARWRDDLAAIAEETAAFDLHFTKAYSLGRGVAIQVQAPELIALRRRLRDEWLRDLSAQDRPSGYNPHVTVQNKVDADLANKTLAKVQTALPADFRARAIGLDYWEYEGGPWKKLLSIPFTGE